MRFLIAGAVCWCALITAFVAVSIWETEEPPRRIVTVDLVELTSDFTLNLAADDLSNKQVEAQSREWAERLQAQIHAVARENNLIILPRSFGVYGAQDITVMIRDAQDHKQEVPE